MDRDTSTSPPPDPVSFVIREDEGYAIASIGVCEAAEFLVTKLEQVNLDDIDPNDRKCPICWGEYYVSEDMTRSHAPVKTVCGHIFGHQCITQCLDPLCYDRANSQDKARWYDYSIRSGISESSCPKCRRVFVPQCWQEGLWDLRLRLWTWDATYARAGVVRSEKEERSRKYLWEYVKFCELFEHNCTETIYNDKIADVAVAFEDFVSSLRTTNPSLTPAQESRMQSLEAAGKELFWLMELARRRTAAPDGTFDLGTSRKFCMTGDWDWVYTYHDEADRDFTRERDGPGN